MLEEIKKIFPLKRELLIFFSTQFCFLLCCAALPFVLKCYIGLYQAHSQEQYVTQAFLIGGFFTVLAFLYLVQTAWRRYVRHVCLDFLRSRILHYRLSSPTYLDESLFTNLLAKVEDERALSSFFEFVFKCAFLPIFLLTTLVYLVEFEKWIVLPFSLLALGVVATFFSFLKTEKDDAKMSDTLHERFSLFSKIQQNKLALQVLSMERFFRKKLDLYCDQVAEIAKRNPWFFVVKHVFKSFFPFFILLISIPFLTKANSFADVFAHMTAVIVISYFCMAALSAVQNFSGVKKLHAQISNLAQQILALQTQASSAEHLRLINASFLDGEKISLYNVTFEPLIGGLHAVVGSPHSGKSTFLAACVGERAMLGGLLNSPRRYEFMAQNAVLFEGTLRENILQNAVFDEERYRNVLSACLLDSEFEQLSQGDLTLADASSFSPSFVRRVALARCFYTKSPYYFFDEPFTGLTSTEAQHVFQMGIQTLLAQTTRFIATRKLDFTPSCDFILVMKEGIVFEQGTHTQLVEKSGLYARFYYAGRDAHRFDLVRKRFLKNPERVPPPNAPLESNQEWMDLHETEDFVPKSARSASFVEDLFSVLLTSPHRTLDVILFILSYACVFFAISLFLTSAAAAAHPGFAYYLLVLASVVLFVFSHFSMLQNIFNNGVALEKTAHSSHSNMDEAAAPGSGPDLFFEFRYFSEVMLSVTAKVSVALFALIMLAFVSRPVFLCALGMLTVFLILAIGQRWVLAPLRPELEFKKKQITFDLQNFLRLFRTTHSSTFRRQQCQQILKKMEKTASIWNRYDDRELYFIVGYVALPLILFLLSLWYMSSNIHQLTPLLLALPSFSLLLMLVSVFSLGSEVPQFRSFTQFFTRFQTLTDQEKERLDREDNASFKIDVSEFWPAQGDVTLKFHAFYPTSYADPGHFPTLSIAHGSCVAVIEKDSRERSFLFQSMLLLSAPPEGSVAIDGVDVATLSPTHLRERLGFVSLSSYFPFLSIRLNLDPNELFDDADIWAALNRVGLAQAVAILRDGMATPMNALPEEMLWSGEVVLFSMARCLLHKQKIILIENFVTSDEIEQKICEILAREFTQSTVVISTDNNSAYLNFASDVWCIEGGQCFQNGSKAFVAVESSPAESHWVSSVSPEIQ